MDGSRRLHLPAGAEARVCEDEELLTWGFETLVGEPDADPSNIAESIIHEVWRLQRFRTDDLQTIDGRRVVILDPGRLNPDQGPDFLDARVVINGTTWAGSIEIHRASSEWKKHGHDKDPHYHAVILHVTLAADKRTGNLRRNDDSVVPEIVLFPRLRDSLRKLQWEFRKGGEIFFACQDHWMNIPEAILAPFLDRLAQDRLLRKAARLGERYLSCPNLDQILYEEIFRCLGYTQNSEAMVLLARRVPMATLRTVSDPRDAASLLLGCAGLLDGTSSPDTAADFAARFAEMAAHGAPDPLPQTIWRNARLRPANSPRRRILQAALLLGPWNGDSAKLVDQSAGLLNSENPAKWLTGFLDLPRDVAAYVSPETTGRIPGLGADRRITIAANAILPILLLHSEQLGRTGAEQRALAVLRELPVVMDRIVRRYSEARGRPVSTSIAQGLHELSRSWCGVGRCRDCPVWRHITSPG